MNVPYVRQYDENGKLMDVDKDYIHKFSNRKTRREDIQKKRFHGNGKNFPLTVMATGKYLRRKQGVMCVDKKGVYTGEFRIIEHYTPR